jgi:hypothetical protein
MTTSTTRSDGGRLGGVAAVRRGLALAWQHKRVVLLAWGLVLVLAWLASLPAWRWLDTLLADAPEGDRLLDGLNAPLLKELFQYDRSPTPAIVIGSTWAFFLVALVLNPFTSGGVIGSLLPKDEGGPRTTVTQRFVRDGVRFYWRFARVLMLAGMLGFVLASLFAGVMESVAALVAERGWEVADLWVSAVTIAGGLAVLGVTSLVIDLARIGIARDDDGRVWTHIARAIRFLLRHARAMFGVVAALGVLLAMAVALYLLVANVTTPRRWPLIVLAMVWQQAFALTRTGLRVSMLAAETALVLDREPNVSVHEDAYPISGSLTSMHAPPADPFTATIEPP